MALFIFNIWVGCALCSSNLLGVGPVKGRSLREVLGSRDKNNQNFGDTEVLGGFQEECTLTTGDRNISGLKNVKLSDFIGK